MAIESTPGSWESLASTVASILGVGSDGAGAVFEQASIRVPKSIVRNTASFIIYSVTI